MKMEFAQVVNKGMQRDYAMNTASQEFAYENKNIRITTNGNESFLSVTNEKSTVPITLQGTDYMIAILRDTSTNEIVIWFTNNTAEYILGDINVKFHFENNHQEICTFNRTITEKRFNYDNGSITKVELLNPCVNISNIIVRDNPDVQILKSDLKGIILGNAVINSNIILFVKDLENVNPDNIYVLTSTENNAFKIKLFYSGDLNFNINNPIECTTFYESDDIQKVYWVDGINQPRVINIAEELTDYSKALFDFVPKINTIPTINIEKQYDGSGTFPSGVIQYYITYYKKFGQETNTVYTSPLYSISPEDRGGEVNETQTCSFKLTLTDVDTNYDYIRIYSFIRTTLNTDPIVAIVKDLNIQKDKSEYIYEVVDTNYNLINVPATDILFLGGNTISASTIEQKDNTLFLGNISSIVNDDDYTNLKNELENNRNSGNDGLKFISRPIKDKETSNTDYGYTPNMDLSSKDKGFKYLEYYRFGLQFQSDTGEWGSTLWLNDKRNHLRPNIVEYDKTDVIIQNMYDNIDSFHSLAAIKYSPSDAIKNIIKDYNSKYYRLVMAEHTPLTRTIKTQGVVMPTLFNLKQRHDKTCFASPVWSTGILKNNLYHYDNIDLLTPTKEEDTYYLSVHPAQQLDSTLYEIKDGYTTEDGHVDSEKALFKILPSATTSNIEVTEGEYLSHMDVEIEVYRENPNNFHNKTPLSYNDRQAAYNSPRGLVLQDMFFFRIKPFTKNNSTGVIEEKPIYTLREFRLAGKVENTIDFLITEMATKTWGDYKNDDEVKKEADGKNLNFANSNLSILNTAEIITAVEFNDRRKESPSRPSYKYETTLYRNGTLDYTKEIINNFKNQYFIDANTCNLWSPNVSEITESNAQFRIVGLLNVNNTISDYEIVPDGNVIDGTIYTNYEHVFNRYDFDNIKTGITSYPLWPGISGKRLYWVFPWNQSVVFKQEAEINDKGEVTKEGYKISIKNKTFANLWKTSTEYLKSPIEYNNINYNLYSGNPIYYKGDLYDGKPQNVLFPATTRRSYIYSEEGLTSTADFKTIEELIENNDTFIQSDKANVNNSVNIKYSSTDHLMFNLGTIDGFMNVLPNYNITSDVNYSGNIDITTNTRYPINKQKINYKLDGSISDVEEFLTLCKEEQTDAGLISALFSYIEDVDEFYTVYLKLEAIGDNSTDIVLHFVDDEYFDYLSQGKFEKLTNYLVLCGNNILTIKNVAYENEYLNRYIVNFTIEPITSSFYTYSGDLVYITAEGIIQKLNNSDAKITLTNKTLNNESKIFLGEFYIPYDPSTFMGGNTENALELNTFIPISDPTPIGETIYGFEGDTYYQQWDCLRIYPTAEEDINKNIDVVSVMLETNINLDGDTRDARGRSDMINVRPANMVNQINPIYSQSNNYITSKILDEKFETSKHPLQYWWSLSKTNMSDIDNWTGVNLTSIAELDGDKGPLNKIKRWNNYLFAFQDKGVAQINFNNQTTLSTKEGLPVEISNSGKVQGHYYITNNYGCKNKWSITETPSGLYFIDSYNKSIMVLGQGIKSISQLNLFEDWIEQCEQGNIWNPNRTIPAFKSFYDPIRQEVYFVNGDYCLCYNELLQQFTSFYDYESLNYMFLVDNHIYGINKNNLIHKMFEGGDYCNLFGNQCDYYMKYKINHNPLIDKTWTNLEYRADIFERDNIQCNEKTGNALLTNKTFDELTVWNEYQNGYVNLNDVKFGYLKEARPRFRVWRTNIPRANRTATNKYGLDRIRNPWIMLELKKTQDTNKRMEFHDLVIKYVI